MKDSPFQSLRVKQHRFIEYNSISGCGNQNVFPGYRPPQAPASVPTPALAPVPDGFLQNGDHVVFFSETNFGGQSMALTPGRYVTANLSIGDNKACSVKIPDGYIAVLYDNDNFIINANGGFEIVISTRSDLQNWDDHLSSVKIINIAMV